MDLTTFGMAGVAAITVICYLAATAVKQTPLANKWLPTICGTLGGVLGGCRANAVLKRSAPSAARWAVCWGCWPGAEVCRTSRQATH